MVLLFGNALIINNATHFRSLLSFQTEQKISDVSTRDVHQTKSVSSWKSKTKPETSFQRVDDRQNVPESERTTKPQPKIPTTSSSSTTSKSEIRKKRPNDEEQLSESCDQVVAEYLKSNGFDEILTEFQACRKIRLQLAANERSTEGTLERILEFVEKTSPSRETCFQNNCDDKLKITSREQKRVSKVPNNNDVIRRKNLDTKNTVDVTSRNIHCSRQPNSNKKTGSIKTIGMKSVSFLQKKNQLKISPDHDMPLDAWVSIKEGFSELDGQLDCQSEVDRVVKYILDIDISVRFVSVKFSTFTHNNIYNCKRVANHIIENCPGLKFNRFSTSSKGDDGKIKENWENLIECARINDSLQCIQAFKELDEGERSNLLRQNVLGCFLAQGMADIRHPLNVFSRAVAILFLWNDGKFTAEEDAVILSEAEKNGANRQTWKNLSQLLKRRHPYCIQVHYTLLTEGKNLKTGKWTEADLRQLFNHLFSKEKCGTMGAVEYIQSLTTTAFSESAEVLGRLPYNVFRYWTGCIKPVLLSYHSGTLHKEWKKDFYEYLIKNKVFSVKDIDWQDVRKHFPDKSSSSMMIWNLRVVTNKDTDQPLYLALEDYLPTYKHSSESERVRKHREDIVHWYDKARGVLDD
jgi:hypothetical protein